MANTTGANFLRWDASPASSPFRITKIKHINIMSFGTSNPVTLTLDGNPWISFTIPVNASYSFEFGDGFYASNLALTALPANALVTVTLA